MKPIKFFLFYSTLPRMECIYFTYFYFIVCSVWRKKIGKNSNNPKRKKKNKYKSFLYLWHMKSSLINQFFFSNIVGMYLHGNYGFKNPLLVLYTVFLFCCVVIVYIHSAYSHERVSLFVCIWLWYSMVNVVYYNHPPTSTLLYFYSFAEIRNLICTMFEFSSLFLLLWVHHNYK